ncbi:MAG: hypothetical protein Cons2KO_01860 [Congregibacter sp.]
MQANFNWKTLSELVGLLAVVVTLVFVGFELRQNTRAVESSATQEVHANFASWYESLQSDPELLLITVKGMQDYGSMNTAEKAQFIAVFMVFSSNCQTAYYKWRDGLLDEELWSGWRALSQNFFSTAGGKAFWGERSYMFGAGFQDFVNNDIMLAKPNPNAKPWGAYTIDE